MADISEEGRLCLIQCHECFGPRLLALIHMAAQPEPPRCPASICRKSRYLLSNGACGFSPTIQKPAGAPAAAEGIGNTASRVGGAFQPMLLSSFSSAVPARISINSLPASRANSATCESPRLQR